MDVTYQHAFTASAKPSSVPKELYEPSPARERFYDLFADVILDKNYGIDEDEIRKAVDYMKSEYEEEHERDINDMIQGDDYKSPWKIKMEKLQQVLKRLGIQVIRMKNLQREMRQSQILKL